MPWRRLDLRPGDAVDLGDGSRWRITSWTLEGMTLALKLRALREGGPLPVTAQPGRGTAQADDVHGPTSLALLDLPPLDDAATTPRLWLAAAGTSAGWRRAAVTTSTDGGASWLDAGSTAAPAIMGVAIDVLPSGDTALLDLVSSVEVELLNPAMLLLACDDDALANGANPAMMGAELIQFGHVEPLGGRRFRLSRLLRGRRGTEAARTTHVAGELFVLVESETLLPLDVPVDRIGAELRVIASGVADPAGVEAAAIVTGRALRPPAPVFLRATALEGGGLRFDWTRRSRTGWAWTDGGEVPLGEETERYRLAITPDAGAARVVEVDAPSYEYGAAEMAADGAGGAASLAITVVQLGVYGASLDAAGARFSSDGETA